MNKYGLVGVHITQGSRNGYGEFVTCHEPLLIKAVDQGGALTEAKAANPEHVTIFRTSKHGDGPQAGADAAWWMGLKMPEWALNPADYYEPTNELDPPFEDLGWYASFYTGCIRIADANGYKLCIQNWSVGTPSDDDGRSAEEKYETQLGVYTLAAQGGHILGLHEYGLGGMLKGSAPALATRYRRFLSWLQSRGINLRIAITEAGQYGGYGFHGVECMIEDLTWYAGEIRKNPQVIGCAWWTLGDWNGANCEDGLPTLKTWAEAHPSSTEPPAPPAPPVSDHVQVVPGIGWLNLRPQASAARPPLGRLYPAGGPLQVVERVGDWVKVAGWAHNGWLEEC